TRGAADVLHSGDVAARSAISHCAGDGELEQGIARARVGEAGTEITGRCSSTKCCYCSVDGSRFRIWYRTIAMTAAMGIGTTTYLNNDANDDQTYSAFIRQIHDEPLIVMCASLPGRLIVQPVSCVRLTSRYKVGATMSSTSVSNSNPAQASME